MLTLSGGNYGGEVGGQLPLQFDKTRKYFKKVGNFFGGIETAMKKTNHSQEEEDFSNKKNSKQNVQAHRHILQFLCTYTSFKNKEKVVGYT